MNYKELVSSLTNLQIEVLTLKELQELSELLSSSVCKVNSKLIEIFKDELD